jgi:chemotaxis protein CheD
MSVITIKTAELAVSHNDTVIKTGSIGSCLVIVLFDTKNRIGGLAHSMLPERKKGFPESGEARGKYVDESIKNLIEDIEKIGGEKKNLIAKLVGGAAMFKRLTNEQHSIGFQNTQHARELLAELGIPIESEDTGGSSGKIVEFNLVNGIVDVYTKL